VSGQFWQKYISFVEGERLAAQLRWPVIMRLEPGRAVTFSPGTLYHGFSKMVSPRSPSLVLTLAQLIRLPAVFTAMSDIAMCACVAWSLGASSTVLEITLLVLASTCVYAAGMVLNDVADATVDRRERSFRPIPSNRIGRGTAFRLGGVLLLAGLGFSACVRSQGSSSLVTCLGLVLAVIAYDFVPSRWSRLLLMPSCRYLNVLLGLSAADLTSVSWPVRGFLAGVMAVYILGITLFARNEAGQSNKRALIVALLIMLAALGTALAAPVIVDRAQPSFFFPYLVLLLGWMIVSPGARAIENPGPKPVQHTVRSALRGIIVLDAALACAVAGAPGLLVLILILPNWYTGKWMSST
jgi:hypothetical protein